MRVSVIGWVIAWVTAWVIVCGGVLAPVARADQVHLVGGAQLDGKATRHGDKVVVEMESGQITLSAEGVERIERGQSSVQRYEELAAKLKPGDVASRLSLADFCRDHDMHAREKELLRQVIELEPDQSQARARLGYVKTAAGWITRDEQLRAQGFVRQAGQWLTPERALELERLRAQSDAAAKERDKAQAELELKKLELQQRKLELEAQTAKAAEPVTAPPIYSYGASWLYGYGPGYRHAPGGFGAEHVGVTGARSFPINGVRDPRDNSWPINGVRDPRDNSWPINGVRDPRQR
jgi:hypothetical protein